MEKLAKIIAEKLNKSPATTPVLIPADGWSEGDREGMPLFNPSANNAFTKRLRKLLNPKIPFEEMRLHINDLKFAQRAVDILDTMMQINK